MGNSGRTGLRIVCGGYLAYIGFNLFSSVIKSRPDNYILFLAVGGLFMILGTGYTVKNVIELIQESKRAIEEDSEEDTEEDPEEGTEKDAQENAEEEDASADPDEGDTGSEKSDTDGSGDEVSDGKIRINGIVVERDEI